jgi:virginiamycin B lyase
MENISKYGMIAAIGSAIIIPIVFFGIIGNKDGNNLLQLPNSDNQNGDSGAQRNEEYLRGAVDANSEGKQITGENKMYLCGSSLLAKSTEFIQEYQIPFVCAQPVGIAVDNQDNVWVAATWTGHLLVFDPTHERFVKFIQIPDWKTKFQFGSMVWGMEFDKSGNLWFADQVNNAIWRYFVKEERFEMYKVPTGGSYPAQIDLDSRGRVWFSEIFGKKLGVLDPALAENNSTKGITEYEIKQVDFETLGPVTVSSKNNNAIWFTTVTFPEGGKIALFDMNSSEFTFY